MVTILSVALTPPTGRTQERTSSSLMCTEQAPHCATPQPYLVPVRPTCSRITHSSGVSASAVTSRTLPLMLSFAMRILSPGSLRGGPFVGEKKQRPEGGRCATLAQGQEVAYGHAGLRSPHGTLAECGVAIPDFAAL